MKKAIFLAVGLLFAAACGSHDDHGDIQALVWDTTGGGDLHFSAVKAGSGYQIAVTQRQFSPANRAIQLDATSSAYRLVDDIFAGRHDVRNDTFVPDGATGTWTTITLVYADNHSETVKNIDASGDLGELYRFVDSHCTT